MVGIRGVGEVSFIVPTSRSSQVKRGRLRFHGNCQHPDPGAQSDYLGRALISAHRQTFEDIEILVGDDTPDALLAPIVAAAGDSRVRYYHHGLLDARRNAQAFLNKA